MVNFYPRQVVNRDSRLGADGNFNVHDIGLLAMAGWMLKTELIFLDVDL